MSNDRRQRRPPRVLVTALEPHQLERLRERQSRFNSVTGRLLDFMHEDRRLKAEIRSAADFFFGGHKQLPHAQDEDALKAAFGRFSEWFLYERISRSYREHPIDTFIARLPAGEERLFAESVRHNVLDSFAVRAVAPGSGLTVEGLLNRRRFEVLEHSASQTLTPGAVLLGRLFPLDEQFWTLSGVILSLNDADVAAELSAGLSRIAPKDRGVPSQRDFEELLMGKKRRVTFRHDEPPMEQLDARAMELLREAGIDADIDTLRARMSRAESPLELFEELSKSADFVNEEQLRETVGVLMALWNTTPRPELDGRTPSETRQGSPIGPQERRLLEEFGEVLEREKFSSRFKTAKRRPVAIAARQREWMSVPRDDLNGRTPAEVIAAERAELRKDPADSRRSFRCRCANRSPITTISRYGSPFPTMPDLSSPSTIHRRGIPVRRRSVATTPNVLAAAARSTNAAISVESWPSSRGFLSPGALRKTSLPQVVRVFGSFREAAQPGTEYSPQCTKMPSLAFWYQSGSSCRRTDSSVGS